MSVTQKWLVNYTIRGHLMINVAFEENDDTRGADMVDMLAEEALKSLQCNYPGVEDFNPGLVDLEEVEVCS